MPRPRRAPAGGMELYCTPRPHGPLAQQSAADAQRAPSAKPERRDQVADNVVVIAGVQRDLTGATRLGDGTHDVHGTVPVEGRDLDRDDVLDLREPAPEIAVQRAAAHRRLEI